MRTTYKLAIILSLCPCGATALHQDGTVEMRVCPEGEATLTTSIPHGDIGGLFEVHYSGPSEERYDIVLIPEGYSREEQDLFEERAMAFGRDLLGQFISCADNINIWGIHVISEQSGIDHPCFEHYPLEDGSSSDAPCLVGDMQEPCPGGMDHLVDTFFNATHCFARGPELDLELVRIVANQAIGCGRWEVGIVFLNDENDAGSGAGAKLAVVSGSSRDIPIHELGHKFGLGDEYCSALWSQSTPTPGDLAAEPSEKNWTFQRERELIKWQDLIAPGVPVPTTENAGCLECAGTNADLCPGQCVVNPCESEQPPPLGCDQCQGEQPPSWCAPCRPRCPDRLEDDPCQSEPVPSWCTPGGWTVGLYEGMNHGRCGGFRPAFFLKNPLFSPEPTLCRMNTSPAKFFCPVCTRAILNVLSAYNHPGDRFEPNGTFVRPGDVQCLSSSQRAADLGDLATQPGIDLEHLEPALLDPSSSRVGVSQESWQVTLDDLSLHTALDNDWFRISLPDPTAQPLHAGEPFEHEGLPFECGDLTIRTIDFQGNATEDTVSLNAVATVGIFRRSALPGEAVRVDLFPMAGQDAFTKEIRCPREAGFSTLSIRVGREGWLGPSGPPCPDNRPCAACASCADYSLSVGYGVDIMRLQDVPGWLRALAELRILSSLPCPYGGFFPHCRLVEAGPLVFPHPPVANPDCRADGPGCPYYHAFVWERAASLELLLASDVDLSYELLDITQTVVARAVPIATPVGPRARLSDDDGRIIKLLTVADLPAGIYVLLVTGTETTFSMDFEPPPPALDSDGDGLADPFDPCPADAEDLDGTRDADGCPEPDIDIKPGDAENPINLRGRGVIPVAILGDAAINVSELDVSTLRFGRCGLSEATPAHELGDPRMLTRHLEDINGDGYVDLVSHYRQDDTRFTADDHEGCLIVHKTNGAPLLGIDTITPFL